MGKAAAAMLAGVLMLLVLPELPSGHLVAALGDSAEERELCVRFKVGIRPEAIMRWRRDAALLWTQR